MFDVTLPILAMFEGTRLFQDTWLLYTMNQCKVNER